MPYFIVGSLVQAFDPLTGTFRRVSKGLFIADSTKWCLTIEAEDGKERVVNPDREFLGNLYERAAEFLPIVDKVSAHPVVDHDGNIYASHGYHERARVFVTSTEFGPKDLPLDPTDDDIAHAKNAIDVFADFGFVDADDPDGRFSRSTALALLMQPFLTPYFTDDRPVIYAIVKPQPRTGTTLLVKSIGAVITGVPYASQEYTDDNDELHKRITAALSSGHSLMFFDNVDVRMTASAFADITSSARWSDRVLGESRFIDVQNTLHVIVTANKLQLRSDIAQRTVFINLEMKRPPGSNREFKHPQLLD